MVAAIEWEKRFRELVDQQRLDEAQHAETEALLSRIIIRLTLAAEGYQSSLDPHLKALREALRQGVTPALQARLDELSDTLMRVASEPASVSEVGSFIDRLIDAASLQGKRAKSARRLAKGLSGRPVRELSDRELEEFLSILQPKQTAEPHKVGFLGRVFGGGEAAEDERPNQALVRLLNKIEWPAHLASDIEALRQRLTSPAANPSTWQEVVSELVRMVAETIGSVESELRETEGFLSTITEHLNELDESLQGGDERRNSALASGQVMSEQINSEVGGIAASVSSAKDLAQLKQSVANRLKVIKSTVDRHLTEYEKRIQEDGEREMELRHRLDTVEREAQELRGRMMHARHQALADALTGLPNRLAWDERLAQEFSRWRRFGDPLTLVVWDMDDFKQVNDRFGHQAGDKALRVVAGKFRQRLRDTDFIARYGGEEFAMLLVGADTQNALTVADELRKRVEGAGFHAGSEAVVLTVSGGIAGFQEGDKPEDVFARADKALYKAKAEGKNRCVVGY